MHVLTILTVLLGPALALPQPAVDVGSLSSKSTNAAASGPTLIPGTSITSSGTTKSSSVLEKTTTTTTTSGQSSPTGNAISSSTTSIDSTSPSPTTLDIISRTWKVTATQTSFVPVSSSVTEIDSKTYYSTWIKVIHPTTVITSTEYITQTVQSARSASVTTVVPGFAPQVTFECVCPGPVTETVYVLVSDVPSTTITEQILHTYTSTAADGQTTTTVIPVEVTTSSKPLSSTDTAISSVPTSAATLPGTINTTGTGQYGQARPTQAGRKKI